MDEATLNARLHAVWAAVYVEVLSSRGGPYTAPDDMGIFGVAEACVGTNERRELAIAAADAAVAVLRHRLAS